MLFYIILIIIILLFTRILNRKVNNGKGYVLVSILLTLIAAVRFDVGWDYPVYYNMIEDRIFAGFLRFEPLSILFILLAIYYDEPFIFFGLTSLIIYPLAFYSFKKNSISPSVSLIVYVALFYLISCSIIRQAIAISICLYAYKYVIKQNYIKFSLLIVLATLFHYSAFVSIIIYIIYHKLSLKSVFIYSFIALLLKNVLLIILMRLGLFTLYLDKLNEMSGGGLTRYFYILLLISFFFLVKRKGYSDTEKKLMSIVLVSLFCPFLFGSSLGERIGYYFLIYYCYLIPLILNKVNISKRRLYSLLFVAYFLFTIFFTSNIQNQKSAYTPYRTIFNSKNVEFR